MKCDICNSPMTVDGDEHRVTFKCTSCQQAWFVEGESTSCIVLKALWPKMDENSKQFREEYMPDWFRGQKYTGELLGAAGVWDAERVSSHLVEVQSMYDKWFADHPLPSRRWWEFWKEAA